MSGRSATDRVAPTVALGLARHARPTKEDTRDAADPIGWITDVRSVVGVLHRSSLFWIVVAVAAVWAAMTFTRYVNYMTSDRRRGQLEDRELPTKRRAGRRVRRVRSAPMQFPPYRPRRLRANETIRSMVRETTALGQRPHLPAVREAGYRPARRDLVDARRQYQLSLDQLPAEIDELKALGIPAVILFGLPSAKDEVGSEAYDEHGIVQEAIRAHQGARSRLLRHHRRVHVRVHEPRPLRHPRRRAAASSTTSRSSCSPRRPSPTPRPAPTWSPRAT